jgi:hypothetical protein
MLRPALLLATLLAAIFVGAQNTPDAHYIAPRTQAIARRSVFVHGYLHGYEEGFHLADLDIQMGRSLRDIAKCKEARDAQGYRREFGDKHFFQVGYREGLRVGYGDAVAGRVFRAIDQVEAISSASLNGSTSASAAGPVFDHGFSQGYAIGQRQGVQDGRRDPSFTPPLPVCPPQAPRGADVHMFCSAYLGGYRIGYADGFTNVAQPVASQVEARAGK